MTYTCTIPGDPFGKAVVSGGKFGRYKDPKTVSAMGIAMTFLTAARQGAAAIEGPTELEIVAFIRRTGAQMPKGPKAKGEQPPTWAYPAPCKPDSDNVWKLIGDSLTQAGVIVDDKAIVRGHVEKWYVAIDAEGSGMTDLRTCGACKAIVRVETAKLGALTVEHQDATGTRCRGWYWPASAEVRAEVDDALRRLGVDRPVGPFPMGRFR